MTDVQVAYSFIRSLEQTQTALSASNSAQFTVVRVSGSVVTLNAPLTGNWEYGVMIVEDGDAEMMQSVVYEVLSNTVTLLLPFSQKLNLAPGDHVHFIPGPLKEAEIYMGDPIGLNEATENGKDFFITVTALSGDLGFRTLPGRRRSMEAFDITYQFEVTVETPHVTGGPTAESSIRATIDLPTLLHQVMGVAVSHFIDSGNRSMLSSSGMSYGYVTWERSGNTVLKAGVLEFDVTVV